MVRWKDEFDSLKGVLEKSGWQYVEVEPTGLEEWFSQGVLYSNFIKKGKAIHLEYGDEGSVFGEEI